MEPFKDAFSEHASLRIAREVALHCPGFPLDRFSKGLGDALAPLELKQRVLLIADRLEDGLPDRAGQMFPILVAALAKDDGPQPPATRPGGGLSGFAVWPLTELVARHGLETPDLAFPALREMTIRFTAEFAVRPFLRRDPESTLSRFTDWVNDPNPHVRRLVSEGSRPLLPWGMRLPELLELPLRTLPLLEQLHRDDSDYVRLSVANHLNDITKFHPGEVIPLLKRWLKDAPGDRFQQKLARHACRSLIKAGHREALRLFGVEHPDSIEIVDFSLLADQVEMGQVLEFGLVLSNPTPLPQRAMVDYRLHFLGANGALRPKVFKWRECQIPPGKSLRIQGRHRFRKVTTRRHYPGTQHIQAQVNGRLGPVLAFKLGEESSGNDL